MKYDSILKQDNGVIRPKVAFFHMPVAEPFMPNLGIERLATIARDGGYDAHTFYASLQFAPPLPVEVRQSGIAPVIFAPRAYSESQDLWISELERIRSQGVPLGDLSWVAVGMDTAGRCLDWCEAQLENENFSCVGFSIGFDAQRLPSIAFARAIRRRFPHIKIIAGGTACDGEMGVALKRNYDCFDEVIDGEADDIILDILARNTGREPSCKKPSISSSPPQIDFSKAPSYSSYLRQFNESKYLGQGPLILLLESSRGCWYGAKNHCTFCGIRNVNHEYRTVSTDNFILQVKDVVQNYSPDLIYLTDAILSREFFSTEAPRLASMRTQGELRAKFFAETKSNLSPSEVKLLADAGITAIQPGIESFLTTTLKAVRKGATGIQQIELLKWCRAFSVHPLYGILIGTPGETVDDITDLNSIFQRITHLPPPADINNLLIHRFSPYHNNPEKYGIEIKPYWYQRALYRLPDIELLQLCYEFDRRFHLQGSEQTEFSEAAGRLKAALEYWRASWIKKNITIDGDRNAAVVEVSDSRGERERIYVGAMAYILSETHRPASLNRITQSTDQFSKKELSEAANELEMDGLIINLDNRILNLAIPRHPHRLVKELKTSSGAIIPVAEAKCEIGAKN